MAQRIKGITIELDGETKGLDKALSDVNKRSREL
jgi:phage-related minor tail protein